MNVLYIFGRDVSLKLYTSALLCCLIIMSLLVKSHLEPSGEIHFVPQDDLWWSKGIILLDSRGRLDLHRWLYTPAGQSRTAADSLPAAGLAPLTAWAQRQLYDHQFRSAAACANATFWLTTPYPLAGIGSVIHSATFEIAAAIEAGHILLWHPNSASSFTSPSICGEVRSWDCFFQPLSNCSAWSTTLNTFGFSFPSGPNPTALVPRTFRDALRKYAPTLNSHAVKYWWRAQAAGFAARLNNRTIDILRDLRMSPHMTAVAFGVGLQSHGTIFPLPSGTISAHVRHGDKGIEMALVPWEKYAYAAKELVEMLPLAVSRTIFLSTEDPGVVNEAATEPGDKWTVLVSDIPRENSNGMSQMALADEVVYFHLGQLLLALEADAWVGTRGSNWNRLIDELRCVWLPKCAHVYYEVGQHEGTYWFR